MANDIGLTFIEFGGVTNEIVGGDLTLGRGTRPGVCRIRVADLSSITETSSGTLTIREDDRVLTLPNCTCGPSAMRLHNGLKDYPEWVVNVYDERYQLRRKQVCGRFNRRTADNRVLSIGKKTATELLESLMEQVGVDSTVSSDALSDVYPAVDWDGKSWSAAVDELCGKLCLHLAPRKTGEWKFWSSGEGDELPSNATVANINQDSPAEVDNGPKTITVECSPTVYGCRLELEAVGLDSDGTIKPIDELSYKPSQGWGWPSLFSYVTPYYRPLAFQSVYRWYRVKAPQTLPWSGVYLNDRDDLYLNDFIVMEGNDDNPQAYVAGIFWGWSDHPYNTAKCPYTSMDFVLDKENRLLKFEHPLFKFGGSDCIEEADIGLYTSFRLRDSTTGCWYKESYSTDRSTGSGERVYVHDDLWRCRVKYYFECPPSTSDSDNESDLATEANAYVNNYAAHWDAVKRKRVLEYPGMPLVLPNGKVQQVCIRINKNQPTTTTASEGFEHNALLR